MPQSLASWNVNGLRACMGKGLDEFIERNGFDLIGLQEIKMHPDQANFTFPGYFETWCPALRKGYSGTLTLTKEEPLRAIRGISDGESDSEGRVVTVELPGFYFVNVYAPNAKSELERLDYRIGWQDLFLSFVNGLKAKKPVVICGDLNVARSEIDLTHPKTNTESAGYTPRERAKMGELLSSGFTDTYRSLYPDKTGAYTWWSFIGNKRAKNVGWRIDYFLVSNELAGDVADAVIFDGVFGSDHCPIGLYLN
ncbi:MAG: exodeoxyribonuclease III [Defluviitaleaceae bacterium]|nr:exodeoxyribonuclease III [Defluviitaleaceae bacterium]